MSCSRSQLVSNGEWGLIEPEDAAVSFDYAADYHGIPLSVSLALDPSQTSTRTTAKFLANLLPESEPAGPELAGDADRIPTTTSGC